MQHSQQEEGAGGGGGGAGRRTWAKFLLFALFYLPFSLFALSLFVISFLLFLYLPFSFSSLIYSSFICFFYLLFLYLPFFICLGKMIDEEVDESEGKVTDTILVVGQARKGGLSPDERFK